MAAAATPTIKPWSLLLPLLPLLPRRQQARARDLPALPWGGGWPLLMPRLQVLLQPAHNSLHRHSLHRKSLHRHSLHALTHPSTRSVSGWEGGWDVGVVVCGGGNSHMNPGGYRMLGLPA